MTKTLSVPVGSRRNLSRPPARASPRQPRDWSSAGRANPLLRDAASAGDADPELAQGVGAASTPPGAVCRLCYEHEGGDLIAPCDCDGTMKWVHRECLNQWCYHGQPTNSKAMTHCPTCSFQYRLYCTFDPHDQQRRKRKRCLRLLRDSLLVFMGVQGLLLVLAVLLMSADHGKFVLAIIRTTELNTPGVSLPVRELFGHHFFQYWSAAILLALFLLGLASVVCALAYCLLPARCRRARAPRIRYGQRECCCDDCFRSCGIYDAWYPADCCCAIGDCNCSYCATLSCEEAGLGTLLLLVVTLIVLGLFVALFLLSMALQRSGQRYLRALHLKDVAERYAVANRATEAVLTEGPAQPAMGPAARPEAPNLHLADLEAVRAATASPTQEQIHRMLQEEIRLTRGVVHSAAREAVAG
mmetsp:Transcript_123260/g.343168  ORF Transcript_123260/g.343168 Transcript_123260/m.343168 type:complete len:414 (+) Transcript_123260:85-1326(+)